MLVDLLKDWARSLHERGLDSVILVVAGAVVGLLGVFGVAGVELLTSVAIGLLSAVAALLVRTDKREAELGQKAEALMSKLDDVDASLSWDGEGGGALTFEYPDLTDLIAASTEVDVVAGLALNVSNQYHGKWREGLARGLRLRLLCPDPTDTGVVSHALFRSVFRKSESDVSDDVRAQINFAKALAETGGSIDIRTIPYLPPFGLLRFAGPGVSDVVFVKLMAFKVGSGQFPVLRVNRDRSPEWYEFFVEQIEGYFEKGASVFEG